MRSFVVLSVFFFLFLISCSGVAGELKKYRYDDRTFTVVGNIVYHVTKKGETLLDIARAYGLGFNELQLIYPSMDPWIPPIGKKLMVPTMWILPPLRNDGIVLNIPELRLYFFSSRDGTVQTYPVGIGDEGWETPVGTYRIGEKRVKPTWYIPPSLREKYGRSMIPPGPDNPLGDYMMKLAGTSYGIHGTNMPWGVGRLVSHGCIRTYPEHIEVLFPQVKTGTRVDIIYEPIKWGTRNGRIFVEVHPDVYKRIPDFLSYAYEKLKQCPFGRDNVNEARYYLAVKLKNGLPFDVTGSPLKSLDALKGAY
ncbi:L,D-transpeptidase family protein [Thermodesulforhabdus norvegica]|uniref:L,D-transpeptidase ErfK/SrfK n=1 Tax=Thermodesulforhabdus norvegica TaxID=39841 RepID=A0A1I4QW94_9BACT|nr:L,D-transpeptidase family protein [Thermodesulforhabdus norvegica]SFM44319.1 L,D-transpeptidase ErfK/SrfK [Thermodesulforhabdus norvegica]